MELFFLGEDSGLYQEAEQTTRHESSDGAGPEAPSANQDLNTCPLGAPVPLSWKTSLAATNSSWNLVFVIFTFIQVDLKLLPSDSGGWGGV